MTHTTPQEGAQEAPRSTPDATDMPTASPKASPSTILTALIASIEAGPRTIEIRRPFHSTCALDLAITSPNPSNGRGKRFGCGLRRGQALALAHALLAVLVDGDPGEAPAVENEPAPAPRSARQPRTAGEEIRSPGQPPSSWKQAMSPGGAR